MRTHLVSRFALLLALVPHAAGAATPAPLVNYQGVLRDQNDRPLSGTYDMTFRFMDALAAGNEILVERHTTGTSNAVVVAGGLFSVVLGTGTLADGTGPGAYASLDEVFRDYGSVWLEVRVGAETLSPRSPIQSAPYALNTARIGARSEGELLNTTTSHQTKNGRLEAVTSEAGGSALYGRSQVGTGAGVLGESDDIGGSGVHGDGYYGVWGESSLANGTAGYFYGRAAGSTGVDAYGYPAGRFRDAISSAAATLGSTGIGVDASGGFTTSGIGVKGSGQGLGGLFESSETGLRARNTASNSEANLATRDGFGISSVGAGDVSSYFANGAPWYSYAYMPYRDFGIYAFGAAVGAQFQNFSTSAFANVGYSSYKIQGNGSVSFVQNHPADPSKVIVYAAPEGDEVAVYTRGSGRLVGGEARVTLGGTFALVTNPDVGLTATVTPLGEPIPLSVVEKSTSELVVRGPAGSNAAFDYAVWGLRIGFEEQSIVQPKQRDARIPSMSEHEQFFETDPSLRNLTALARFSGLDARVEGGSTLDLTRATRLRDAIGVFARQEPATEFQAARRAEAGLAQPLTTGRADSPLERGARVDDSSGSTARTTPELAPLGGSVAGAPTAAPAPLVLEVTEPVEAGDLLTLDPSQPGRLRRASSSDDAGVAGVAANASIANDGIERVAVVTALYATVKADARYGAIRPGDLLVSSATPGHAMSAAAPLPRTVIGKALQPLDAGTGLVLVLLGAR